MVSVAEYVKLKKAELKEEIERHEQKPSLFVLQLEDNPSNTSYIKGLKRDCEELGIDCDICTSGKCKNITTVQAANTIYVYQRFKDYDAILVQTPLPYGIDPESVAKEIDTLQDVDGFTEFSPYEPCTPKGVVDYLEYNNYEFDGKTACVVGRSKTVGSPLAQMLLDRNCTVTVCHSHTGEDDLAELMAESNIVFTCTNQIEQFGNKFFSGSSDVIDFGLGIGKDGKLHGNIKKETLNELLANNKEYYERIVISGTGGTGLLTRIALMENIVKAAYGWGKDAEDSEN